MVKMIRLLISSLIICLVNGENVTIHPLEFININSVITWGNILFEKSGSFPNMSEELTGVANANVHTTIKEVKDISNEYNSYLKYMYQKQLKRLTMISKRVYTNFVILDTANLNDHIDAVERCYTDIQRFDIGKPLIKRTLEDFSNAILWGTNSLPNTLKKIYEIIFPPIQYGKPGFMQEIINDSAQNLQYDCDRYTSTQQYMYFIYICLLITEMKGFSILTNVYLLLQKLDMSSDYTVELKLAKDEYQTRVMNYNEHIKAIMASSPRAIHRCEVNPPQRDITFLEFVHYNRVLLIPAPILGMTGINRMGLCNIQHCNNIDHRYLEYLLDVNIDRCMNIALSENVNVCSADPNSTRKYLWWNVDQSIYGHHEPCPEKVVLGNGDSPYDPECRMCACSTIETISKDHRKILNFCVTPQISDIQNNMIVVGVKFVMHDNAMHLQIQQSKLLPGQINGIDNSTVWKALDDHRSSSQKEMSYKPLSDFSGMLHLDDVMLPPKYAVTGVKIDARKTAPAGFFLQVHGTPYDWKTGELDQAAGAWFIAGDYDFSNVSDYKRNRITINSDDLDDPVRCNEYNYDPETNKIIQFHHSSIKEDAGQSTVPYIDALPVETYPSFPLSGIGLFYRKKTGCGGYIAPRIFTIDISQYK